MENKLTWEQVFDLSKKISTSIKRSGFKPDYLIGITAGGLIPLGLLAQGLDIRNILTVSVSSYNGRRKKELKVNYLPKINLVDKNILLIDELSETGQTLEHVAALLRKKYRPRELRTATLAVNIKKSKFRPDFSPFRAKGWVIFPWEKD